LISTLIQVPFNSSDAFPILETFSRFGVLFIYLTSNFSLLRVSIRRLRRKLFGGIDSMNAKLRNFAELALAVAAVVMTSLVQIFSMLSSSLVYVTLFLGWIVIGYILIDVRDIVFQAQPRASAGVVHKHGLAGGDCDRFRKHACWNNTPALHCYS